MITAEIEELARRHPRRVALREGGEAVTFGDVWARAQEAARRLARQGASWPTAGGGGAATVTEFLGARLAGVGIALISRSVNEEIARRRKEALAAWSSPRGTPRAVFYSSGSVGAGSPVPLDEEQLLAAACAYRGLGEVGGDDRVAVAVSPAHVFGFVRGCLDPLLAGAEVAFLEPGRDVVADAERAGASLLLASGRQLALAALGRGRARLRGVLTGGNPLPENIARRLEDVRGVPVRVGYGLTESAGLASRQLLRRPRRSGTCGPPAPGMEVELREGEIFLRGRAVFAGYAGTSARPGPDERGWLPTGDLGELGDDGELRVFGRRRFSLEIKGRVVCAEELEAASAEHGSVLEAAAVPLRDSFALLVVAVGGRSCDAAEIRDHLGKRLPTFARPRVVRVVASLPKTPGGKIDRVAAAGLL